MGYLTRRRQGVKTVGSEFVGRHIAPNDSLWSGFFDQLGEDPAQPAFRVCHLATSMHERTDVGGTVSSALEADGGICAHDFDESRAHRAGAGAQFLESLQMILDMLRMVRDQDRLHVGEVLVERRSTDAGGVRNLRHGQRERPVFLSQSPCCLSDGLADRAPMTVDRFLPQLRHANIVQLVMSVHNVFQFNTLCLEHVLSTKETKMTGSAPDPTRERSPDGPPGLPQWVKLLAFGVVIAVVVLVLVMLLVGGEHGPGMHGG